MRSAPPSAGVQSFPEAAGPEAQLPVGLGEAAAEAAQAAPAHEPTNVTGETLTAGVAARLNAWWESGRIFEAHTGGGGEGVSPERGCGMGVRSGACGLQG